MHLVIGTSGHIDHGKSTLVRALTGTDPDRLAEEKARGITIDLGFAHYTDPSGNEIAFVDVPGHERFVHNMLAGAAGMDAVLMVVAADEGVMPQTLEHLHICDLLGIGQGVIALTRVDLVDEELLELSMEDVRQAVQGTFLAEAPMVPVSSITGQGLDALRTEITKLTQRITGRHAEHPLRFPVDRSFTIKGFGTVVTGTLLAGRLTREQEVVQYPQGRAVRVRGLQVHGRPVEVAEGGQRVAVNLSGVGKEEINRGDQLAAPESLLSSYILNVELRLLEDAPRDLTQRTRIRLHLGTQEVMGRIVLLEEESLAPGERRLAQLRLEEKVCARFGDRFILRNYSPIITLGGGRVIDPAPVKARRLRGELAERLRTLAGEDESALVETVIYLQTTRGVKAREGFLRTGLGEKAFTRVVSTLSSQGRIMLVDPAERKYLHEGTVSRLGQFMARVLRLHHQAYPEREGMTRVELSGKLAALFEDKEVGALLARLVKSGHVEQVGQEYRIAGHEKSLSEDQEGTLERLVTLVSEGGVMPPRRSVLFQSAQVDEKFGLRILKLGTHNQRLIRVSDDFYYTPAVLTGIESQLRGFLKRNGQITVIDFKDLAGVTRGHAVALLEYFDAARVTLRLDNHRVLRETPV
ncbi:MAG: selenocysteine-specific translation elongation factor [Deltaproteobacteria bacterium]|nr:selenocysteine-specific translation elongation factor [Deltaproteobacteria bacterium]